MIHLKESTKIIRRKYSMKDANIVAVSLFILGVLFLLNNFGFIAVDVWDMFWKAFWPLLLIGLALNMFLKNSDEKKSEKSSKKSKKR